MAYPTNPIYKLIKNEIKNNVVDQVMTTKGSHTFIIPFDEGNTDYQAYLSWVAEGNTAEAAD
tara:strand:+ start:1119 stop:1304 length:186 start_codon:yes stop_codon:yes gene_type:complete